MWIRFQQIKKNYKSHQVNILTIPLALILRNIFRFHRDSHLNLLMTIWIFKGQSQVQRIMLISWHVGVFAMNHWWPTSILLSLWCLSKKLTFDNAYIYWLIVINIIKRSSSWFIWLVPRGFRSTFWNAFWNQIVWRKCCHSVPQGLRFCLKLPLVSCVSRGDSHYQLFSLHWPFSLIFLIHVIFYLFQKIFLFCYTLEYISIVFLTSYHNFSW